MIRMEDCDTRKCTKIGLEGYFYVYTNSFENQAFVKNIGLAIKQTLLIMHTIDPSLRSATEK